MRIPPLFILVFELFSCGNQTPGEMERLHVPEGYFVERATPPGVVKYPMFATLDDRGRLFVAESSGHTTSTEDVLKNPTFFIRLLEDADGDGVYEKSVVFADSIPYTMGGTYYRGSFYAAAPPDLLRLTDTDGDGVADEREVILTGWTLSHNAATLSGPFFGPDGWMYLCDARRGYDITTREGTRLQGKGARIWRCRPDGTGLEVVSGGGFDNTIELAFMPSGETIGTMTYFTDPRDGLRDAVMHWVEGGVYPKDHASIRDDQLKMTGPLMPVMTRLARVSHSGIMRYRSDVFDAYHGNLFTAEFNTGRLMRHTVAPDGASYRTTTEPFMTSDIPDFHPTDVLEDADGSILFVNTGGWFIAGCPLSVVAKTDVHGGIFRIRKTDPKRIDDPWGRDIDLKNLSSEELARLETDIRPVVRDRAVEELVLRGDASIDALASLLKGGTGPGSIAAVFALYRVGGIRAMGYVVSALDHADVSVRVAAARACGLSRERSAVDRLIRMLTDDQPPARRQAATALGQIGDARAVEPLIAASEHAKDRFVEHAIIYALITLRDPDPIVNALAHASDNVRKSALIALDQMDVSPLKKDHLEPFLSSDRLLLRNTGLWVLMHHPTWTDVVLSFSARRLAADTLTQDESDALTRLLVAFSTDAALQRWLSGRLGSTNVKDAERWMLLDVMRQSRLKAFPVAWRTQVEVLLAHGSAETQERVLTLVEARGIEGLEDKLSEIFLRETTAPVFRLKALGARMASRPELSDTEFKTLLTFLDSTTTSTVRQSAVRALVQANLNEDQLMTLARDYIPEADAFLLPGLVSAFEGSSREAGEALISSLTSSPERLELLSLPDVESVLRSFDPGPPPDAQAFLALVTQHQGARLSALKELEASLGHGDVGAGRDLFYGKALCSTCHAVAGNGATFGPDLTNIGEIRSQHDILEAIVYPSASFAREYETSRVTTASAAHTGIVMEQLPESILLASGPGVTLRIATSDILAVEPQPLSMMPPGLDQQLSREELSDLVAYLRSLPDGLGHLKH